MGEEEEPADGEVGSLSEAVQEDIETDMNQTTEVGKETDKEDRYNVDEATDDSQISKDDGEKEEVASFKKTVQDKTIDVIIRSNDEDMSGAGNLENDDHCIDEGELVDGVVGGFLEAMQEDKETAVNQTTEEGQETKKEEKNNVDEETAATENLQLPENDDDEEKEAANEEKGVQEDTIEVDICGNDEDRNEAENEEDEDDGVEEEEQADREVGSLLEAVQEDKETVQENKENDMNQTIEDGKKADKEMRMNEDEEAAAMEAGDDDDEEEVASKRGVQGKTSQVEIGVEEEMEVNICNNEDGKEAGTEEDNNYCRE